jgi:hypothetical protein
MTCGVDGESQDLVCRFGHRVDTHHRNGTITCYVGGHLQGPTYGNMSKEVNRIVPVFRKGELTFGRDAYALNSIILRNDRESYDTF